LGFSKTGKNSETIKNVKGAVTFRFSSECENSFVPINNLKQNKMKKTALIMIVALTISAFANAQTRVEIKSADLPKAITDNIAKDFNGFAIQNAYKVNTNNQSTYELIVVKGPDKEKLEYSSTGTFIKKAPVAHLTAQNAPAKRVQSNGKQKIQTKPQTQPMLQPPTPQKTK
jgi:hypothetical protein